MERESSNEAEAIFVFARARAYYTALLTCSLFVGSLSLVHGENSTPKSDLNHAEPARRIEAIQNLKSERNAATAAQIHTALASETDPLVQMALMDAAGAMPEFGQPAAFARFLSDERGPLRKRAAYTLGLIGGRVSETMLRQALSREADAGVKAMLLQSLSVCASAESLPDLQRASQDLRPEVRAKAQEALKALARPEPNAKPAKGQRSK